MPISPLGKVRVTMRLSPPNFTTWPIFWESLMKVARTIIRSSSDTAPTSGHASVSVQAARHIRAVCGSGFGYAAKPAPNTVPYGPSSMPLQSRRNEGAVMPESNAGSARNPAAIRCRPVSRLRSVQGSAACSAATNEARFPHSNGKRFGQLHGAGCRRGRSTGRDRHRGR